MNSTPRFGLPFLSVGQAQKEVSFNEAIQTLDTITSAAVEEPPANAPPAAPVVGSTYVVGDEQSGDWIGQAHSLATFTAGGWRYVSAQDGIISYVRSTDTYIAYREGRWQQLLGRRGDAIASPSGGMTIDTEARGAIDQVLAALRQHGLIEN